MSDTRWSDQAAAYVLDALEPEERAAFEERMADDADLQSEVAAYRAVVARVAEDVPTRTPPSGLRERILAEARTATPEASDAADRSTTASVPPGAAPPASAPASAPGAAPGAAARRPAAVLPWLLAAAGLVASLGVGVVARRASQSAEALRQELALARGEVAGRDSLLASFLGPDVRTATLAATGSPPSARLFWNPVRGTVVIVAFDLPPAPAGRTYQLWGIAPGGDPVSLGTFQTAADGTALVQRPAPGGIPFEVGAVTEEPAGGSPQPTTQPFLVGSWAAQ